MTESAIVIKYGGSLLEDEQHQAEFLRQVVALSKKEKVALVHGGGKEITKALEASGIPTRFINGRRYTDDATMAVVEKTLAAINARIVSSLKALGVRAAGFSGRSDSLLTARAISDLGRVGRPETVDLTTLSMILRATELPVFYSVAQDIEGTPLNLNADDFALALAVAARSPRLLFLTDTGGILDKAGQPIASVTQVDVERLIADQTISGGMAVKARACVDALSRGVGQVDIAKGIDALVQDGVELDGTSFLQANDQ